MLVVCVLEPKRSEFVGVPGEAPNRPLRAKKPLRMSLVLDTIVAQLSRTPPPYHTWSGNARFKHQDEPISHIVRL